MPVCQKVTSLIQSGPGGVGKATAYSSLGSSKPENGMGVWQMLDGALGIPGGPLGLGDRTSLRLFCLAPHPFAPPLLARRSMQEHREAVVKPDVPLHIPIPTPTPQGFRKVYKMGKLKENCPQPKNQLSRHHLPMEGVRLIVLGPPLCLLASRPTQRKDTLWRDRAPDPKGAHCVH